MRDILHHFIHKNLPLSGDYLWLTEICLFLLIVIISCVAYFLMQQLIVKPIEKLIQKTRSKRDDFFVTHNVFRRFARIISLIIVFSLSSLLLDNNVSFVQVLLSAIAVLLVFSVLLAITAIMNASLDMYHSFPTKRQIPMQSFSQVAKLIIYGIALIIIISILIGESPLKLFAGLGALTAVLMLIFKDPILGLVAGIQLSFNKMVAIGDWVEIPQHRADGSILEIGLTTVKIRNFDNTITTVPTQDLVNNSFKNWRGMQESTGRRVKRALYIDIKSIRFSTKKDIQHYQKFDLIQEYVTQKQQELAQYNSTKIKNIDYPKNGRHMTNLGTFRTYVVNYLKNHPGINTNLTVLVRQLAATDKGVPLEVYVFIKEKEWIQYEAIQSDIFDHLYSIIEEFNLKVYQCPSGNDVASLATE